MAGSFGSFMQGFERSRQQRAQREDREHLRKERDFQDEEREYQRGRRGVLDARQDTTWDQSQEDRTRDLSRDAVEYPIRFQSLVRGNELQGINLDDARFNADRREHVARQADQLHDSRMADSRQRRAVTAQNASYQQRLQAAGIEQLELEQEHQQMVQMLAGPARAFAFSNNLEPLNEVIQQIPDFAGGRVVEVEKGQYAIQTSTGEVVPLGGRDGVLEAISMVTSSPEALLNMRTQGAEPDKPLSAYGKTVRDLTQQFPPKEGETQAEYNKRMYDLYLQQAGRSPDAQFRRDVKDIYTASNPFDGQTDEQRLESSAESARRLHQVQLDPRRGEMDGSREETAIPVEELRGRPPSGTWVILPNGKHVQVP